MLTCDRVRTVPMRMDDGVVLSDWFHVVSRHAECLEDLRVALEAVMGIDKANEVHLPAPYPKAWLLKEGIIAQVNRWGRWMVNPAMARVWRGEPPVDLQAKWEKLVKDANRSRQPAPRKSAGEPKPAGRSEPDVVGDRPGQGGAAAWWGQVDRGPAVLNDGVDEGFHL